MNEQQANQCADAHAAIMQILEGMSYDQKIFALCFAMGHVIDADEGNASDEDVEIAIDHAAHTVRTLVNNAREA